MPNPAPAGAGEPFFGVNPGLRPVGYFRAEPVSSPRRQIERVRRFDPPPSVAKAIHEDMDTLERTEHTSVTSALRAARAALRGELDLTEAARLVSTAQTKLAIREHRLAQLLERAVQRGRTSLAARTRARLVEVRRHRALLAESADTVRLAGALRV
jgi:hypothetical protein